MADKTKIDWADASWSPVTGCTPVSEGCKNCYAANMAKRFWGDRQFSDVQFHRDRLEIPEKWKKPRRIFVCSISDLFNKDVKDSDINSVFLKMLNCDRHTYIVLTKRPERMQHFIGIGTGWRGRMENVIIGVTAENQEQADKRIAILLRIPAAKRLISVEPMLSEIDIEESIYRAGRFTESAGTAGINWVIAGCESGSKRRPTDIDWIRNLRDQCMGHNIPFFLKQMEINGKVVKMPKLDGKIWNQYPK